jgi:hypothetical protein
MYVRTGSDGSPGRASRHTHTHQRSPTALSANNVHSVEHEQSPGLDERQDITGTTYNMCVQYIVI